MQESIFETECVCTLDNLKEMSINTRRISYVLYFYICYIALFVFGVVIPIYNDKILMAILVSIVLNIVGIVYIIMPRINAKKQYEAYQEMCNGKELTTKVIIYDDKIENIDMYNNKYTEIEYSEVRKIIETNNLYNLMLNNGTVIMLEKKKFIKGDSVGFLEFIKNKI